MDIIIGKGLIRTSSSVLASAGGDEGAVLVAGGGESGPANGAGDEKLVVLADMISSVVQQG